MTRNNTKTAKTALIGLVLAVFASLGFTSIALAQSADRFGVGYAAYTGLVGTDPRIIVANIIRIALGLLGTVALVLVLYAGFKWMTAQGDTKQVDEAKKILTQAVIGLVIIMSAFAITTFIMNSILSAMQGTGTIGGGGDDGGTQCIGLTANCPAGALGSGIIESHYPGRGATGVPRNTRIIVTFKSKINPASLTMGPAGTLVVIRSSDIVASASRWADKFARSATSNDFDAVLTADGKTLALVQKNCSATTPEGCLGSPASDIFYTVALRGGTDGVKKADGQAAFAGSFGGGYLWEFQISTKLDLTPPQVVAVVPEDGTADNPRNTLIRADFSEAIDPISASAFGVKSGSSVVRGENQIGNAYRTIEFRTDAACGINSCGETIYCLPANAQITVAIRACGLSSTPPLGVYPPNGITDMAGNSLDGDADGKAEGPATDDYGFRFSTNDTIDLTPPTIVDQQPAALTGNVARDLKVGATFSKLMSATSLTTSTALLTPTGGAAPINYAITSQTLMAEGGAASGRTQAQISHDLFGTDSGYAAAFTSGLRDLHQNCFYPGAGSTVCVGKPFCCNGEPATNAADWKLKCALP